MCNLSSCTTQSHRMNILAQVQHQLVDAVHINYQEVGDGSFMLLIHVYNLKNFHFHILII